VVIKKEIVDKKTGDKKVTYTTDKPGWKIVMKKGQPIEIKMSQEEIGNRDHGANTDGHGAEGSKKTQQGLTKTNTSARKEYRDKKNIVGESSTMSNLKRKAKKVEDLAMKLKKAKLDLDSSLLDQKMAEFNKKEAYYKKTEQYSISKRSKLKEKNNYFVKEEPKEVSDGKEKIDDVADKLEKILTDNNVPQKEEEQEVKTLEERLDKAIRLEENLNLGKVSKIDGDLLDRIEKLLKEAEEDEEESKDDSTEEEPSEEGEDELPEEEEDGMPIEKNEIELLTKVNNFDLDANNAYAYYDYIFDRLNDETSKKALNGEYNDIDEKRRKVTPARELFDRAIKRLEILNRTEQDRLNNELSGEGGEEEDDLEI
jgi:hypothetical protein